jgi:hypothetical protein
MELVCRRLDFTNVTDHCQTSRLDNLARAFDPAAFNLATKDILEKPYHRAGKMDAKLLCNTFLPRRLGDT